MSKGKHTTVRLSDAGRGRLERYAPDHNSQTAAIEDALIVWEQGKIAFGQQVQRATAQLVDAVQSGDERAIGGAQMALAELLHSLPAATGIAAALRDAFAEQGIDEPPAPRSP